MDDITESGITAESASRWELRSLIAMAICATPDIALNLSARPTVCVCKRDYRPLDVRIPRCLDCLGKADAALRLLDLLDQQRPSAGTDGVKGAAD